MMPFRLKQILLSEENFLFRFRYEKKFDLQRSSRQAVSTPPNVFERRRLILKADFVYQRFWGFPDVVGNFLLFLCKQMYAAS